MRPLGTLPTAAEEFPFLCGRPTFHRFLNHVIEVESPAEAVQRTVEFEERRVFRLADVLLRVRSLSGNVLHAKREIQRDGLDLRKAIGNLPSIQTPFPSPFRGLLLSSSSLIL